MRIHGRGELCIFDGTHWNFLIPIEKVDYTETDKLGWINDDEVSESHLWKVISIRPDETYDQAWVCNRCAEDPYEWLLRFLSAEQRLDFRAC